MPQNLEFDNLGYKNLGKTLDLRNFEQKSLKNLEFLYNFHILSS